MIPPVIKGGIPAAVWKHNLSYTRMLEIWAKYEPTDQQNEACIIEESVFNS